MLITRLPPALRLVDGNEHVKRDWNDVTFAPNGPHKVVERHDYNYAQGR